MNGVVFIIIYYYIKIVASAFKSCIKHAVVKKFRPPKPRVRQRLPSCVTPLRHCSDPSDQLTTNDVA